MSLSKCLINLHRCKPYIITYCKIPFFFSAPLGPGSPSMPLIIDFTIVSPPGGPILSYNISLKYNSLFTQGLTSIFKLVRKSNPACCIFHVKLAKKSYTTYKKNYNYNSYAEFMPHERICFSKTHLKLRSSIDSSLFSRKNGPNGSTKTVT